MMRVGAGAGVHGAARGTGVPGSGARLCGGRGGGGPAAWVQRRRTGTRERGVPATHALPRPRLPGQRCSGQATPAWKGRPQPTPLSPGGPGGRQPRAEQEGRRPLGLGSALPQPHWLSPEVRRCLEMHRWVRTQATQRGQTLSPHWRRRLAPSTDSARTPHLGQRDPRQSHRTTRS